MGYIIYCTNVGIRGNEFYSVFREQNKQFLSEAH